MNLILNWLNTYQGIAQWLIWSTAVLALIVAYREYISKRRPYIDWEIQVANNPNKQLGGWIFFALIKNSGTYPALVRVKKTLIRIGDEEYPSEIKNEIIVAPETAKKSAMIGSIYESGIQKIRNNKYKKNRVEIEFEIESKPLGDKKMKYKSYANYEINIDGEKPNIILITEKMT